MDRVVVSGDEAWAAAVGSRLLGHVRRRPDARLCLATGSTPIPVYAQLAAAPAVLAGTSVLLLDEFVGLPADEPGRCDAVLRRSLLAAVTVAEYRPIHADVDDLPTECAAVDAWIDRGPDGIIDLAVLGLGRNGHLGMNEPGSPIDGRTAHVDLAPSTIEDARRYFDDRIAPTSGITVGLGDLLAAREVWVLATGAAKAAIVARSCDGPPTPDVPASLLQHHPDCTWWLDAPAAGR